MNHNDLFDLLRTVHNNVRCPQCGRQYIFSDMKIRGIVDTICFLELNCTNHMPLIATVTINAKNGKEKNNRDEKIKADDVIDIHKFLKEFNGSFENVFKNDLNR